MYMRRLLGVLAVVGALVGGLPAHGANTPAEITVLTIQDLPPGFEGQAALTLVQTPRPSEVDETYYAQSANIHLVVKIYGYSSHAAAESAWPTLVQVEPAMDGSQLLPFTIGAGTQYTSSASYVAGTQTSYEDENFLSGSSVFVLQLISPSSPQTRRPERFPQMLRQVTTLLYGRITGSLKAPILSYDTVGARHDPEAVNLTLHDLPTGFTIAIKVKRTSAQEAKADGLPLAQVMKGGQLSYSDIGFSRNSTKGRVQVEATVGLFRSASDAEKDTMLNIPNLDATPDTTPVDLGIGPLGANVFAVARSAVQPGQTQWYEEVLFYRGPYEVIVQAGGPSKPFNYLYAYDLAKIIDERIRTQD